MIQSIFTSKFLFPPKVNGDYFPNFLYLGYGIRSDGRVVYVNASTCDINYTPCNPAVVFDVPLPKGQTKS